jgi:hypothetical protein
VTPYRIASSLQAIAYLGLMSSLLLNPPQPVDGKATVADTVAGTSLWIPAITFAAFWVLVTAVRWPYHVYLGHTFLVVVVLCYGVANFGTSVINDTGWQIASLCLALAAGHVIAIKRRPVDHG